MSLLIVVGIIFKIWRFAVCSEPNISIDISRRREYVVIIIIIVSIAGRCSARLLAYAMVSTPPEG